MYYFNKSSDLDHNFNFNSDYKEFKEFYDAGVTLDQDSKRYLRFKKKDDNAKKMLKRYFDYETQIERASRVRALDKLAQVANQLRKRKICEIDSAIKNVQKTAFYRRKYVEIVQRFSGWLIASNLKRDFIAKESIKVITNTFYCATKVRALKDNSAMKTMFCKNRLCISCQRVKAGRIITKFEKSNIDFTSWHLLTLTIVSEELDKLPDTIRKMLKNLLSFRKVAEKRKLDNSSFRTIEITYQNDFKKPAYGKPHPHLHILCRSKEYAEQLMDYWLEKYTDADRKWQDIRPFDGNFLELTKYVTKIKFDYPTRFYQMLIYSMSNIRQFQTSGCLYNLNLDDLQEIHADDELMQELYKDALNELSEINNFTYDRNIMNWVDTSSGELLVMSNDEELDEIRSTKDMQSYLEKYQKID